jgi:beta-lactamase regulating signal transducer with metallopeptidase domain
MNAEILSFLPSSSFAADALLKATLVLAAAGASALALRRSSAAARHLAWCLGLGAALLVPLLSLALPAWSWRVLPDAPEAGTEVASPATAALPRASGPREPAADFLAELDPEGESLAGGTASAFRPASASLKQATAGRSWRLPRPSWDWLWVAWLAGASAVLAGPISGRFTLRRWAREAEPMEGEGWDALLRGTSSQLGLSRRVRLLRGERASMPMTWGWLRPVILLPADAECWDADRRRHVLLHELAHVRRLDGLTQWIAHACCAAYWFHPLCWLAARRMRVERERACDDVVLRAGVRASDYAGCLLAIARACRASGASSRLALEMARPSQIEGRLRAILDPARPRGGLDRKAAALAALAMMLVGPLAALRVAAKSVDDPPAAAQAPAQAGERMTVSGRVLDPQGKPVADAPVMVVVEGKYAVRRLSLSGQGPKTVYEARGDGSGRFRVDLPRTSSARIASLTVAATAPGFGMGWAGLDPDAERPQVDVSLQPEVIVHGRFIDESGRPAAGVALWVSGFGRARHARLLEHFSNPDGYEPPPRVRPGWPNASISDADGRFTLRGLGRGWAWVRADGPRYDLPWAVLQIDSTVDSRPISIGASRVVSVDAGPDAAPIVLEVHSARTVVGRVTYADTGRPVPQARIGVQGAGEGEADAEGRFRLRANTAPSTNRLAIMAQAPGDEPYLIASDSRRWEPEAAVELTVDFALARGVVVRGKVVEEGTGRPVAGASVQFIPYSYPPGDRGDRSVPAVTGPDGSYRVVAPAGPGYLVAQSPDDDHVLRLFGSDGGAFQARPGRGRSYAHAYRALELKPDGPDVAADLAVRKGVTVRGLVVSKGEPAADAWIFSPLNMPRVSMAGWREWHVVDDRGRGFVRDGRFTLHGLDPEGEEVPACFLDPDRKLGAMVRFSAKSAADGPVTVQLEACGTATARLVDPDGKPLERFPAAGMLAMVVTPGPLWSPRAPKEGPLFASASLASQLDPVNHGLRATTDAQGRVAFTALIPAASYCILDRTTFRDAGERTVRKEFTVKPGESLDLGDILIAKPESMPRRRPE